MATYVLVHGGWTGGWLWKQISALLQAAGHEVYRPTLTGLGERIHLASPNVDLETHIHDVLNVFTYERLTDVILVGYSYSGMVVTAIAERIPEKIRHLVYFDSYIPTDGQSLMDILGAENQQTLEQVAREFGDGWCVPYDPSAERHSPHPMKPVLDKVSVQNPAAAAIPRTYIRCTQNKGVDPLLVPIVTFGEQVKRDPTWKYRELDATHGEFWETHAAEAAALLLELA